ncbi:ATP-dependent DNA helicase RecG [Inediibacterium massiliense]|uniref:ATP-dependent DNA helicase RecG n=1 Tax=Inediibacterium massiliense TaxID=1658111 RepID=UPI0006B4AC74|nr:ATP-dependent DNA helicase RecG [Inediibacterium massiliense]
MEYLKKDIQYLKGVGPKKAQYLKNLGICTIEDLLYFFPREYEDRREIKNIATLYDEEKVTLKVTVCEKTVEKSIRKGLTVYKVPIKDYTGRAYAVFYNTPFIKKIFKKDARLYLYGKIKKAFGEIQILHPSYEFIEGDTKNSGILSVYPLTQGLTNKDMSKFIDHVLEYLHMEDEYLPKETIKRNRLCSLCEALLNIHRPDSVKKLKIAKFRLVFEELFILQIGLWLIKNKFHDNKEGILFHKDKKVDDFIHSLPYQLTDAQNKVLDEIIQDLTSKKIMNRLVQGDVGSGKTIIAFVSLYLSVLNGYQGVLMAPTEILAQQHFLSAQELLAPLGLNIELLVGSVSKKRKEDIREKLENGEIHIIIGTHALIEEYIAFKSLGLVITDEQHRFGVRQRKILSSKGINPHVLVMTATPIPRTLGLILYGDLDISIIDKLPPGRKKIKTYCVKEEKRNDVYDFAKKEIVEGRQIYVVAPLVEESENIEAKSATQLYEELKNTYFKEFPIGLLHGKMKPYEKDEIMEAFKKGYLKVLVSTTVIEVGVNVPNASVMIIENSERFGLAQLHQLRGRVGRGAYQSYCALINYSKSKLSKERMDIMQKSNNGFMIAQKDLELRGPGEFFGTRQHGLPELKIANLFKHINILKQAQQEAALLLKEDPSLLLSQNVALKNKVIEKFGDHITEICL